MLERDVIHKRTSSGTNHGFAPMAVQISATLACSIQRLEG
jgi:hypothetical protein